MILWFLCALATFQAGMESYSARAVVSDPKGAPLRDLEVSDVSLTQGGLTLTISRFERDERPANIAILIDSSQAMATAYRAHFIDAAKSFVGSLPANSRVSIWSAGDRPAKVVDNLKLEDEAATREALKLLSRVQATGGNTILDAIVEAAEDLQKDEGERKIIVFLSGEGPGFSNDNRQSIVDRVMKTGVEVTGALAQEAGEASLGGEVSPDEYDYVFSTLTERTGGRLERPLSVMGVGAALTRLAADLRSTYRLTFHSSGGRPSRLALQVARPGVKARLSTPRRETSPP